MIFSDGVGLAAAGNTHEIQPIGQIVLSEPKRLPDETFDTITPHRRPDLSPHTETDTAVRAIVGGGVNHQKTVRDAAPNRENTLKIDLTLQPLGTCQGIS